MLQYYTSALAIPALIVVEQELAEGSELEVHGRSCWPSGAAARSRSARPSAAASGASSSWRSATRGWRSTRRSSRPSAAASSASRRSPACSRRSRLDAAARADRVLRHLARRRHAHRRVDGRVRGRRAEEGRLPPLHHPVTTSGNDDFASMNEVLSRRYAQWEKQHEKSPYDSDRDASFAALPNLVVIDGGPGQLSAGPGGRCEGFRERGVAVVSLAKRIEEVFLPGVREPLRMAHDTPELQLLQRVRDEAHRFAITHHRIRRDKAMTESIMDELPGDRAEPQARAAAATSARPRRCWAPRASSSRRCPGVPRQGRARPLPPPQQDGALMGRLHRPRRDLRLLRGREVVGDERVRGRRLLLRRQPAAGDDPLAGRRCSCTRAPRSSARASSPTCAPATTSRRSSPCSTSSTPTRGYTRVLFLEADEDTLLTRYKETRRRHPQARNGNVADGIHREQALLAPIRERADTVVDTTGLSAVRAAPQGRVGDARAGRAGQARGDVRLVRPQARPGARRRPGVRRPLPAQPALGAGPAPADRVRPADRRLRRRATGG